MLRQDLNGLEPLLGDVLQTDGARPPLIVREGQVVEDAGPAEHVTTLTHLPGCWRKQADGTGRGVIACNFQINLKTNATMRLMKLSKS